VNETKIYVAELLSLLTINVNITTNHKNLPHNLHTGLFTQSLLLQFNGLFPSSFMALSPAIEELDNKFPWGFRP